METERCLFIGGPADGRWIEVPCGIPEWHVAVLPFPQTAFPLPLTPGPTLVQRTHYRRELWHTPDSTWSLFVVEGMTITEAMQRLIEAYAERQEPH